MKINFPTFFTSKDFKLSKKSKKKSNSSSFSSSSSEDSVSSSISRSPKTVLPFCPSSDLLDGDKITARDLERVIRRLGHSPISDEELSLILAEIVADDDGCIALDSLAPKPSGPGDLRDAFAVFDADGDGRISAEELLGVFVALGDGGCTIEQCRRMIGAVDSDGDGFVCFQDFVRLMDGQRSC